VYKTDNLVFDQTNAFVRKDELARLTGLSATDCHEIGVLLHDEDQVKPTQAAIKEAFPALSVMNWLEISPDAGMLTKYMDLYYYILMGFILFALAFGIINTMLMAILERTKELGMLMAIGMSRKRIFYMIMLETIFLTLVGALFGMALGWLAVTISGHTGLDFSVVGEGFEAMGWSAVVYPSITPDFFFGVTLLVIATGILSSILPARKALSLIPVDAIKSDN
jgi:ABC-type antimicrobial peptide transport system permease subunit